MRKAIAARMTQMRFRYGSRGMVALVVAMGALAVLPIPIPGLSFLPLYIAELARKQPQDA
jgi:hypothetical protein